MDKDEVIRLFKALGDPTRYAIVEILQKGPLGVGDLVLRLGKSQPAVSIALAKLAQASIVTAERQGNAVVYSLAEQPIRALLKTVGASRS